MANTVSSKRTQTLSRQDAALAELTADLRAIEKRLADNVIDWRKQRKTNSEVAAKGKASTARVETIDTDMHAIAASQACRSNWIETAYQPRRWWFDAMVYYTFAAVVLCGVTVVVRLLTN